MAIAGRTLAYRSGGDTIISRVVPVRMTTRTGRKQAFMSSHELAQLNVALMKEPLESPAMADFVANLDRINALAESSPGFLWRLQTEEGNATALRPLGAKTFVNMSRCEDTAHRSPRAFRRRRT